jgi:hypothetical protein
MRLQRDRIAELVETKENALRERSQMEVNAQRSSKIAAKHTEDAANARLAKDAAFKEVDRMKEACRREIMARRGVEGYACVPFGV